MFHIVKSQRQAFKKDQGNIHFSCHDFILPMFRGKKKRGDQFEHIHSIECLAYYFDLKISVSTKTSYGLGTYKCIFSTVKKTF